MKKTIGIDLGTTNSVVAFKTRDVEVLRNRENEELTRSCVALKNEQMLVGRHALNVLATNPENTILSVKRLMGGAISDLMVQQMRNNKDYYRYGIVPLQGGTDDGVAVVLGGKQYTPEQISAEILKKLKEDAEDKLGDEVTHAVITVPAYFTEKQKNATRLAATYAGLKVLRLLAEPTAAALAYGVDTMKAGELQTVVVYDFGGGTFDLSVLNIIDRECLEMGAGGDRWLGGDNLDQALQAYIFRQVEKNYNISSLKQLIESQSVKKRNQILAKLRTETEKIKIDLSGIQSQSLLLEDLLEDEEGNTIDIDLTITRADFEQVIRPFVEKTVTLTEELLAQMSYTPDMINAFLLVGGSSCIPLVKQLMAERFGADKVRTSKKPMLAIAEGAAMLAQSMGDSYECPNCGIAVPQSASKCPSCGYDVDAEVKGRGVGEVTLTTKHDLYIMTTDRATGQARPERLFEKQTPMPASTSRVFRTAADQQQLMRVEILSDVEGGRHERQTLGFAVVEESVPASSEFVFDFTLSADESMSCKFYPKGYSNKAKSILLERGQKDAGALAAVSKAIEDFNKGGYDAPQRNTFTGELVKVLQVAGEIGPNSPMDARWAEVSYKAGEIKVIPPGVEDPEIFIIETACLGYPQLIGMQEVTRLRGLLSLARRKGTFESIQAIKELGEAVDEYWWLDKLDDMKYASRHALQAGSSDGGRLRTLHDQAVVKFEQGDHEAGFAAMLEGKPLVDKHWPSSGTGKVDTSIVTG